MPTHSSVDRKLLDQRQAHQRGAIDADARANAADGHNDEKAGWWRLEARRHRLAAAEAERQLRLEQERRRHRLFATVTANLRASESDHFDQEGRNR